MDDATLTPTLIRVAEPEDAVQCLELMAALQATSHWRSYPAPDPAVWLDWLARLPVLLVAGRGARLIGLCGGGLECSPLFPDVPYVKESILYVREEDRWTGLAHTLFRQFCAYGRLYGAKAAVRAKVLPHGERVTWIPVDRLDRMRQSELDALTEVV